MSETPICERMLKKPAFSPSEWIEEFKRLERAANAMRATLERSLQHHGCDPCHITEALEQFDALKKP